MQLSQLTKDKMEKIFSDELCEAFRKREALSMNQKWMIIWQLMVASTWGAPSPDKLSLNWGLGCQLDEYFQGLNTHDTRDALLDDILKEVSKQLQSELKDPKINYLGFFRSVIRGTHQK